MKIAIMQPTYLPWIGYFDLIRSVDHFVFLDDVPLAQQRPNWQKENRILINHAPRWLKLPVERPFGGQTLIHQARLAQKDWQSAHLALLAEGYEGKAGHIRFQQHIADLLHGSEGSLCDLNIGVIRWMMGLLGLSTPTSRSSSLTDITSAKGEKIIEICKAHGATAYLSPKGAQSYCTPEDFSAAGLSLTFQDYTPKPYPQDQEPFIPYMSAIDLLMRHPDDAATYL